MAYTDFTAEEWTSSRERIADDLEKVLAGRGNELAFRQDPRLVKGLMELATSIRGVSPLEADVLTHIAEHHSPKLESSF